MSENSLKSILTTIISENIISHSYKPTVGVLLPAKGRPLILRESLYSLAETRGVENLEVVIVADQDLEVLDVAKIFPFQRRFADYKVILNKDWLKSVKSFCVALENCDSFWITWMNDENIYHPEWLDRSMRFFFERFPDQIGLLSMYKPKKAGLGITSRAFIKYNMGEFFWPGYEIFYPDDEITCRAILLGRYAIMENPGINHRIEITERIPIIPWDEKIKLKKVDRSNFYRRTENNFGLPPERIYEWKGFRELNLPLKG